MAIALMVALAAVVLPVSMSWLPAAGLDEVSSRLEASLSLARADAQRRGVVLEVVAVTGSDGVVELRSREVRAEPTDSFTGDEFGPGATALEDEPHFAADAGADPRHESEDSLLADLPRGIVLRRVNPAEIDALAAEFPDEVGGVQPVEGPAGEGVFSEDAEVELVIALALPDGRIVAEEQELELRAIGSNGRWVVLTINGWTGAVVSRMGVTVREEEEASEPREDPAEAP